jgi:hypothetical protein
VLVREDSAFFSIVEFSGEWLEVHADGQTGLEMVGHWDEDDILAAGLFDDNPFAERCWEAISGRFANVGGPPESESPARNERSWQTLVIRMGDGVEMTCAAARFDAVRLTRVSWARATGRQGWDGPSGPDSETTPDWARVGARISHRLWGSPWYRNGTVVDVGTHRGLITVLVEFDDGQSRSLAAWGASECVNLDGS